MLTPFIGMTFSSELAFKPAKRSQQNCCREWIPAARLLLLLFLLLAGNGARAQFYNGLQMSFGKNRLQYNTFQWTYLRYDRFDVYYYQEGEEIARYVAKIADKKLSDAEELFYNPIDNRLIFIVYSRLSDFRQSNIGLTGFSDEYNIGGTTNISDNKVSIYFDGSLEDLERQVSEVVAEVVIQNLLTGSSIRDKLTGDSGIDLPEWFQKGLERYTAQEWSVETDARFKNGFLTGQYHRLISLTGEDAALAGQSFWFYIARTYGKGTISDILYLTRVNRDFNSAFYQVLGTKVRALVKDWEAFYCNRFSDDSTRAMPTGTLVVKHPKAARRYMQVKLSANGKYLAYVTNEMSQQRVWLYDIQKKRTRRIFSLGYKLEQIPDYTNPVLAWHPSSTILTFTVEEEGWIYLYFYNTDTRELTRRMLPDFRKVLSYSFSPNGTKLVLSAVTHGQNDMFIFNMSSGVVEQITNDPYADLDPRFIRHGRAILFTSNRPSDTLQITNYDHYKPLRAQNLFIVDYPLPAPPVVATRLDDFSQSVKRSPVELTGDRFAFTDNKNGIANWYVGKADSAVSYVDTAIHYRYFMHVAPHSDYKTWISSFDVNPVRSTNAKVVMQDGRFKTYLDEAPLGSDNFSVKPLRPTVFRAEELKKEHEQDSIAAVTPPMVVIPMTVADSVEQANAPADNAPVDINSYVFEDEKLNSFFAKKYGDNFYIQRQEPDSAEKKKVHVYHTTFYPHYLVNQIDFGFLNSSYQAYTGGAVYFNPGLNVLFKVGTRDLFEDYRLVGGVRFASDFASNEYLLSFEDLKGRWDKQLVFHRQAFKNETATTIEKVHSHELVFALKYPFTQVSAFRATFTLRHDRQVMLATDYQTLGAANTNKLWSGVKFEYVFDNTIRRGINILYGTRYKFFEESYVQDNGNNPDLHVVGFDFRHYQKIHRDLIFAWRFATSTSFGKAKLVYYLGSVDNWINFSSSVPTFNNNMPVKQAANYAFQTLASNLRGFPQNVRNGNSFAVINNEVRWPFVRYFANRSLSSGFWNNLQVCLFGDIGSAWTGLNPYGGENGYDKRIEQKGTITVEVDTNLDPIVYGYGFGVRSKILGYFMRFDWAWGVDSGVRQPRIFYFSLSTDF